MTVCRAVDAVPALSAALKDEDNDVRTKTATALGLIGPAAKDAVPALYTALKEDDEADRVRVQAAVALWRIQHGKAAAADVLIKALQDKDKNTRWIASYALSSFSAAKEATPALIDALKEG